ncbi:hypothetical protein L6R52_38060 [Myxococcota bacterium]|nr:hypothetical protein [Myxococcota bacterium]
MSPCFAIVLALVASPPGEPAHAAPSDVTDVLTPRAASDDDAHLELRISAGGEWDTNARRAISGFRDPGGTVTSSVVSDGSARLVADLSGSFALGAGHVLELGYVLGAKRFFAEGAEDLLVHDLRASSEHPLVEGLRLSTWGTLRATRMRSGTRDYSLGAAGLALGWSPVDTLVLRATGAFTAYDFDLDDRFSYRGPTAGGDVSWRPFDRVVVGARADYGWRRYDGNGLQVVFEPNRIGVPEPRITSCEGTAETCTPEPRRDTELQLAVRAAYRGKIVVSGEWMARIQRSTSDLESIDRHRFTLLTTFPLPFELTGNVLAALQVNSGVSLTDTKFLVEDDGNQNTLQAQLSRRLGDGLSAELRWALFANQFTTSDVSFLRQTVYFGLSYRIGS